MSWLDKFLSAYNTVQSSGVAFLQRSILNFTGDVTVADNTTLQRTDITVTATASGTPLATPDTLVLRDGGAAAAFGGLTSPSLGSTSNLEINIPSGDAVSIGSFSGLQGLIVLPDFASSGGTLWAFGSQNVGATIGRLAPTTPGVNVGTSLEISAGDGRDQSGGAANNNGLDLYLKPGKPGTGGSGGDGVPGNVYITPNTSAYPAPTVGLVRVANPGPWASVVLAARNHDNTGDVQLLSLDSNNAITIGETSSGDVTLKATTGKSAFVFIGGSVIQQTITESYLLLDVSDHFDLKIASAARMSAALGSTSVLGPTGDSSLVIDDADDATLLALDSLELSGGGASLTLTAGDAAFGAGVLVTAPDTWARKVKASDQSVTSSTTVVDVTGLEISVGANETWTVTYHLHITSSAAGGARINFSLPAGATGTARISISDAVSPGPGTAAFTTYAGAISASPGGDFVIDTGHTSDFHVGTVSITVTTSATSGQIKLQFAQGTSDGTATKIKAGTPAIADRVS